MATKYRKKPVVVEAMVLDGHTVEVARWLSENGATFHADTHPTDAAQDVLHIETLEGTMRAAPGDWIIRGVAGEFYPCKPDIFEATYEPADATLATVRPNPDDARQVEVVARALFLHSMGQEAAPAWDAPTDTGKGAWLSRARAVLTALAALAASPKDEQGAKEAGVDLIAAERRRQIESEGYDAEHDRQHPFTDYSNAAAAYALNDNRTWPWAKRFYKPEGRRGVPTERDLVRAGALIAAAIDRLRAGDPRG